MTRTITNLPAQQMQDAATRILSPALLTLIALIAYAAAAYFLVYCLHHDEHFQIIEFANYKLGKVPVHSLPWEFEARLRPAIQPLLTFGLLKMFNAIAVKDPFDQAFALRLLSSFWFITAAARLRRALLPDLQSNIGKQAYLYLSLFLYALPMTGVRFSSENVSSCLFTIAFAQAYFLLKKHGKIVPGKAFRIGFIFGLSFLFRYQSALLLVGFAAWLLVRRRKGLPGYLIMLQGFIAAFLAGILIDRWFYGEWVISAWNYLDFNILEGKSSGFGVSPLHFYLTAIDYNRWFGFLNASLVAFVFLFLIVKPKHPVSWIFLTFFVAHSLIPHKETRFLYPILIFVPFMYIAAFEYVQIRLQSARELTLTYLISISFINLLAFIATIFSPVDNSTEIFRFIRTLPDKPIKIYYSSSAFMFTLNDGTRNITPHFYKDHHKISEQKLPANFNILSFPLRAHTDTLTFIVLDREVRRQVSDKLKPAFDPQPEFVHFLNYRNWMRHGESDWKLYRVPLSNP